MLKSDCEGRLDRGRDEMSRSKEIERKKEERRCERQKEEIRGGLASKFNGAR